LRRLDLFAPLSPPQLERLALSSGLHEAETGEVLIHQGDIGDRFYAVRSGQYSVEIDGLEVAVLGAGDYFGEIALLRDVPRTASVTSVLEGDLLVLEREPFLLAMSQARPRARE
jgi:CRP-like cAMP-binding protein